MRRFKLSYVLLGLAAFYLVLICVKFPEFLENATVLSGDDTDVAIDVEDDSGESTSGFHNSVREYARAKLQEEDNEDEASPNKKPPKLHYGRITAAILKRQNMERNLSILDRMADEAWNLGSKAWEELDKYEEEGIEMNSILEGKPESCPSWVSSSGAEIAKTDQMMFLPCGLAAGSSITVIGTPHYAHHEYVPQLAKTRVGDALVLVSQFMIELQGLKSVVGEDPPKILHLNPRIRGDWSRRPVIEHNTCYRMQWGTAHRCDGLPSKYEDDMLGKTFSDVFLFDFCLSVLSAIPLWGMGVGVQTTKGIIGYICEGSLTTNVLKVKLKDKTQISGKVKLSLCFFLC